MFSILKGHFRHFYMKKNILKATPTERLSYKFSISTLCTINSQQSSFVPRIGTKIRIGPWTKLVAGENPVYSTFIGRWHPHNQSSRKSLFQSLKHFSIIYLTFTATYLLGCLTSVHMVWLLLNVCGLLKVRF